MIVLGGGDTGSDCVGTSIRQGALSVTQLEILPCRPKAKTPKPLALLAQDHADLVVAGGGLPAPLEHVDEAFLGHRPAASTEIEGCEVEWVRGAKGWEMKKFRG